PCRVHRLFLEILACYACACVSSEDVLSPMKASSIDNCRVTKSLNLRPSLSSLMWDQRINSEVEEIGIEAEGLGDILGSEDAIAVLVEDLNALPTPCQFADVTL
ncbi:hypothetical protein NL676_034876, partial [Syzygium grande]